MVIDALLYAAEVREAVGGGAVVLKVEVCLGLLLALGAVLVE